MFIHLVTMWQGSWAGTATLCIEVECRYMVAVSAWYSMHQLPGCKCAVKPLRAPVRCIYTIYMSIYSNMQTYIHAI